MIYDDGRLHLYYAGCEGLHSDSQSTEPVEVMIAARPPSAVHQYRPLRLGGDTYSPIPGCTWFHSGFCRASWKAGRLWAAVPLAGGELPGMLTTREQQAKGRELHVNVVTVRGGMLRAELLQGGKVVPGFALEDCVPVTGDDLSAPVRWQGGARCPVEEVQVRFSLLQARLYGFDWKDR
jgi:hypothetical protein